MRGAPQVGFSETIRKIRARTSLLTRFRPPTRLDLEIHAQYKRNPARCQFTTVRGVSKTREFLHPDQNILKATQNSLCRAVNRRRGRCVCKASSCRRRARFSRTRFSRERKELTIHPRRCRSDTIMARILSELSEFSFTLSHSFCRCTTFWRDTGLRLPDSHGALSQLMDTIFGLVCLHTISFASAFFVSLVYLRINGWPTTPSSLTVILPMAPLQLPFNRPCILLQNLGTSSALCTSLEIKPIWR